MRLRRAHISRMNDVNRILRAPPRPPAAGKPCVSEMTPITRGFIIYRVFLLEKCLQFRRKHLSFALAQRATCAAAIFARGSADILPRFHRPARLNQARKAPQPSISEAGSPQATKGTV